MSENNHPITACSGLLVVKAMEFASRAHKFQKRKGADDIPYISHPASVGLLLANHGFSEPVVLAGILHDVIEDTEFTFKNIQENFGNEVARLVQHVSEDKSLPWLKRKQSYTDHLRIAPNEALLVCAADSLANLESLIIGLDGTKNTPQRDEIFTMAEQMLSYVSTRYDLISTRIDHPLVNVQWSSAIKKLQELITP